MHLSIYPNMYIIDKNPNTPECIHDEFNTLFELFSKAFRALEEVSQKVLDAKSKKKLYLSEIAKKSTIQFFL